MAGPESTKVSGLSAAEMKKQDVDMENDEDEEDEVSASTVRVYLIQFVPDSSR